ncbi:MAG TPA: DNA-3-methyladenine glycosylase [Pyrinomonadaceae bacterium]|nr:DNA-3-methyladenine glycosylase [Pyrinomonadaceae bacterium]
MSRGKRLRREFYLCDALTVARQLLGKRLVVPAADCSRVSGVVVETEAYMGPEDKASHARGGRRTARTETMYARGGVAYVYFIYGMYFQFNVVTNVEGVPHAALVRAVEPSEGLDVMRARRPVPNDIGLTSGPGKLCAAFGIDRTFDGEDLLGRRVWLEDVGREVGAGEVEAGPRVGIDYAEEFRDKPWRFWLKGNPYVSRR